METISRLFDRYALNARLRPALLTLFPAFVTTAVLFPATYKTLTTTVVSLAVSCGVLMVATGAVRRLGRHKENQLYKSWGGMPTTAWLRHRDTNLDPQTKKRYHAFLLAHVPHLTLPTVEEEKHSPDDADSRYRSGTKWLLEYTRDKKRFPLVFEENINYGFARNCLAMKPFALGATVLCVAGIVLNIWMHPKMIWYADSGTLVSLVVAFGALALWILLVSEKWVTDAAEAYTRALLAACDA
jgi:hypothetical protein